MCFVKLKNLLLKFGKLKKKTSCLLLSGVLLLLLFVGSSSYCAQVSTLNDFESNMSLIMGQMPTNNDNYKALTKLFNSNAWASKKSSLPFTTYSNLVVRSWKDNSVTWYIDFIFYNNSVTYNVTTDSIKPSSNFTAYQYRFDIQNLNNNTNPYYDGNSNITIQDRTLRPSINDTFRFSIFFCDSTFINAQNLDIWGVNFPVLDYYSYNYNSNLSNIVVDDFNTMKQINISDKLINIADFGRTSHFNNAYITYWAYKKDLGYFEPYTSVATTSYNIINTDLGEIYFTSDEFLPNTIMQFVLVSNDLDNFSSLSILYYCIDNNTIIVNGELDTTNTFNNNYYNKYRYDLSNFTNTNSGGLITNASGDTTGFIDLAPINNGIQDINNNLTDDSQVDNIVNFTLSGDSDYWANEFGFNDREISPLENPISVFLFHIMESTLNALTLRGNVTLDFNHHNTTDWVINSSDFSVPDNPIKSFVRLCLIFIYVLGNYKMFHYLLTLLQTAKIDKAVAILGTDEFYDSDIM